MREILFRGKRVDSSTWEYGNLIISPMYKNCIMIERRPEYMNTRGHSTPMVDPETVGQYTGLKDKNGVKIFEGDIVSSDIVRPYLIVEFRNGCFMFNCNDGGEDYYDIMLPILQETQTVYQYGEVIGNIHDNPELIKK